MNITKITVGADPEFFLIDSKAGSYVSAHGMIPGTKEAPHPVPFGAIQVDGTAVEFNIDPAETAEQFVHNIQAVIGTLRKMIPDRYTFAYNPVATYSRVYFSKLPREAVEIGCTPDWNGYTMQHNKIPNVDGVLFRTGSGHVHLGWEIDGKPFEADPADREHILLSGRMARNLDITLGIPSLEWDHEVKRRLLYGKAGCFRPKPYGMEYRTLSNKWLSDTDLMTRVFNGAVEGARDFLENGPKCKFMGANLDQVQRQINNG